MEIRTKILIYIAFTIHLTAVDGGSCQDALVACEPDPRSVCDGDVVIEDYKTYITCVNGATTSAACKAAAQLDYYDKDAMTPNTHQAARNYCEIQLLMQMKSEIRFTCMDENPDLPKACRAELGVNYTKASMTARYRDKVALRDGVNLIAQTSTSIDSIFEAYQQRVCGLAGIFASSDCKCQWMTKVVGYYLHSIIDPLALESLPVTPLFDAVRAASTRPASQHGCPPSPEEQQAACESAVNDCETLDPVLTIDNNITALRNLCGDEQAKQDLQTQLQCFSRAAAACRPINATRYAQVAYKYADDLSTFLQYACQHIDEFKALSGNCSTRGRPEESTCRGQLASNLRGAVDRLANDFEANSGATFGDRSVLDDYITTVYNVRCYNQRAGIDGDMCDRAFKTYAYALYLQLDSDVKRVLADLLQDIADPHSPFGGAAHFSFNYSLVLIIGFGLVLQYGWID